MKILVYSQNGKEIKQLNSVKFDGKLSDQTLASYINYIRSSIRNHIANTLDRSEVSGGGKKPWRQKGTGRARVGSSRSPLWTHGGVTFGPVKGKSFKFKINKKVRELARKNILIRFLEADRAKVVDKIILSKFKTADAEKIVNDLEMTGKISFIIGKSELKLAQAFRNLPYIILHSKDNIDILNIISSDWILFTEESFNDYFVLDKDK